MAKRFIGRDPIFRGKTLYEICCNLRNFGEGRVVYRFTEAHFPETCYVRLTKVEPDLSDSRRLNGKAWGESVYRGIDRGYKPICSGHKPDWLLVPRADEAEFCKITAVMPPRPKPPSHVGCPPVLELLLAADPGHEKDGSPLGTFQLKLRIRQEKVPKPKPPS